MSVLLASILTENGNSPQASYEGGGGNDVTLPFVVLITNLLPF